MTLCPLLHRQAISVSASKDLLFSSSASPHYVNSVCQTLAEWQSLMPSSIKGKAKKTLPQQTGPEQALALSIFEL